MASVASNSSVIVDAVKLMAVMSSTFLTGSTATYSFLWIPTVLSAPDDNTKIAQWRLGYRIGFHATRILVFLVFTSWTALAFLEPVASATSLPASWSVFADPRVFFPAVAVWVTSLLPFTLTYQRPVNGGLSRRANKLLGKGNLLCDTYAVNDKAAIDRDNSSITIEQMIRDWASCNWIRTVMAASGTMVGILGTWFI